jgi:hypothetical protein
LQKNRGGDQTGLIDTRRTAKKPKGREHCRSPPSKELTGFPAPILQLCLVRLCNVRFCQNTVIRASSISTLNRSQGGFGVGYIERFEHAFLALREQRLPCRSLAFTEAGLVLGAGTFVARRSGTRAAMRRRSIFPARIAFWRCSPAAFSAPVDAAVPSPYDL